LHNFQLKHSRWKILFSRIFRPRSPILWTPMRNILYFIFRLHARSYWGCHPSLEIFFLYQDTQAIPRSNKHQTKPDEDFSKSHGPNSDCSLYLTHQVVPEFLSREEHNVDWFVGRRFVVRGNSLWGEGWVKMICLVENLRSLLSLLRYWEDIHSLSFWDCETTEMVEVENY